MVWAGVEFAFALLFMTALSLTVWNMLRWVLMPILLVGGLTSGVLFAAFRWKEWRNGDFKRFWAEFDLSEQGGALTFSSKGGQHAEVEKFGPR